MEAGTAASGPAWRAVVQRIAEERAREESRDLWGDASGAGPSFNYRWEHLRVVVELAQRLAADVGADVEVVTAAAWLHDIAKEHGRGGEADTHGRAASVEARSILAGTDFPAEKVDAVCTAIESHVGLTREGPLPSREAEVLWDADKLSKLGATGLLHSLCAQPAFARLGGYTPDTPTLERQLLRWLGLAEKIVANMNTAPGRRMAAGRLRFLRSFVEQLQQELRLHR